ncbi:MAG: leucyl aminopeptidase family protein [Hyphomonadaceae bacterium]
MTDVFSAADAATPLDLVTAATFPAWVERQSPAVRAFAAASGFRGEAGKTLLAPGADGTIARAAVGLGKEAFSFASAPNLLPAGDYALGDIPEGFDPSVLAIAWADGAYRFTRYKAADPVARLKMPDGVDAEAVLREAAAIAWLRDLVNTPAADLGPSEIAAAAVRLAEANGASVSVVEGADLERDYPMVAAVGRAASDGPRMIELTWSKGEAGAPRLVLVGKGVAFDTGGLNLKTGAGMGLMKKDMGGSAHALALARLVMEAGLNVNLTLLVPTVENAIGAGAFRPGDVLTSRKGLTVEIDNTDAEGRLILADALARGSELDPDLMIDFATLTGAARVALGPELAPLYTDDDALAEDVLAAAKSVGDPVWRMPMWDPYVAGMKSSIADTKNTGDDAMGGSITAALFLKKFVDAKSWAHLDVWAWRKAAYGRPAGAAANGFRAVWAMLQKRYPPA